MWAVTILIWVVLGLLGGYIFAQKGYPPTLGIIVGVLVGPIGIAVAAVLPRTKERRTQMEMERETKLELQATQQTHTCPKCGRENSAATRICPRCECRYL